MWEFQVSINSPTSTTTGLFDIPPWFSYVVMMCCIFTFTVQPVLSMEKMSILLSISNDAAVQFIEILPSISHETTVSLY